VGQVSKDLVRDMKIWRTVLRVSLLRFGRFGRVEKGRRR
jgi:hypothetical protein